MTPQQMQNTIPFIIEQQVSSRRISLGRRGSPTSDSHRLSSDSPGLTSGLTGWRNWLNP
jgi:hypothetical protein